MGTDIFIRLLALPLAVRAVTLPNEDGTYDIYVNEELPAELRQRAAEHELRHIQQNHFYDYNPVWINEMEAG